MGNVGNIEKVMVFGILAIIICILCIAVWGHNAVPEPAGARAKGPGDLGSIDDGPAVPPLKRDRDRPTDYDGGDDPIPGPRLIEIKDDEFENDPPPASPRNVTDEPDFGVPEPAPAPATTLPRTHTVRSGDNFSSLAQEYFGDANLYVEFEKANEDVDPRRLRAGMVLNVPQLDVDEIDAPRSRPSRERTAARASGSTAGGVKYVVKSGDTLSSIARQFYGAPTQWRRIADANPAAIPNPDRLKVGVEIEIP
ncbi:MAG: LysM peptidoglycan-binding domain-containing protein [Planctomycetota bacterium JB042]